MCWRAIGKRLRATGGGGGGEGRQKLLKGDGEALKKTLFGPK